MRIRRLGRWEGDKNIKSKDVGNFFNDMYVGRRNENQEVEKWINVPIKYGPRQKSHDFRTEQETGEPSYISPECGCSGLTDYAFFATRLEMNTHISGAYYFRILPRIRKQELRGRNSIPGIDHSQ